MSTTPKGVTITAKDGEGNERVITEGVQVLYDHVIESDDWLSGFLSLDEVAPIVDLAQFCGLNGYEEAEEYMEKERVREKRRNCSHPEWDAGETIVQPYDPTPVVKKTCLECGAARYVRPFGPGVAYLYPPSSR